MPTSDRLKAARDVLLRDGWCQGTVLNARGERCLEGALLAVCHERPSAVFPAWQALAACVPPCDYNPVTKWNDVKGRQPEEVLAVFDRAIAWAQQQEQPDGEARREELCAKAAGR